MNDNVEYEKEDEQTLVIQDQLGNYYVIPVMHMRSNQVLPDYLEDISRIVKEQQPSTYFQVLGVIKISRDLRRKFSPPIVSGINIIPSPPS